MDAGNPYEAPRAEVGVSPPESELGLAVRDLVESRRNLIAVAVFLVIAALFSGATTVTFLVFRETNIGLQMLTLALGWVVAYLVMAAMLIRFAHSLRPLAQQPTFASVTVVLNLATQVWATGIGAICAPTVLGYASSYVYAAIPALGSAIASPSGDADVVSAARRLCRVVRAFLIAGGAVVLLQVGALAIGPAGFKSIGIFPAQMIVRMLVALVAQLGFGWLVWRQVPALEGFIAAPSAATLLYVAATHRLLWRVTAWGCVLLAMLAIVGSTVAMILLAF